jgi:hypothetical protein
MARQKPGISAATHHSTETRKKMLEFEALVAPSELSSKFQNEGKSNVQIIDDDPVVYWTEYIEFVASIDPDDEKSIHDLRARATRALIHLPKYYNDVRFLRICILAADSSPQPLKDFQALHDLGIGIKLACFWMVWAFKAEQMQEFHTATAVYIMALKYEVVPIKIVRQRYTSYKARMKKQGISYDPRRRKRKASPIHSCDDRGTSEFDCSSYCKNSSDSSEYSKQRRRVTMTPTSKPFFDISNHVQSTKSALLFRKNEFEISPQCYKSKDEMSYEMRRSNKKYYNTLKFSNNFNLLAKANNLDGQCIFYNEIHKANIEHALKELSSKSLAHHNEILPLVLLKPPKKFKSKSKNVNLNGVEYTVKRLLGKGHYGTVVLLESGKEKIALKVQQPVSCLCWECHILRQVSKRLSSKSIHMNFFPRPLSFTMFQNGATLGLSVGSEAGLTLVDIVNVYKGSVPELLVIYYTRQLFQILSMLHIHCNILVSVISFAYLSPLYPEVTLSHKNSNCSIFEIPSTATLNLTKSLFSTKTINATSCWLILVGQSTSKRRQKSMKKLDS